MLHINDLTYRIGGRELFSSATAVIPEGHKVGLVGRNGSGKSTLLRLILEEIMPDGGTISLRPRARVMMVAQEAPDGPQTLLQTVLGSHRELSDLTASAEKETDPHRIAEIHIRLSDIGAHAAEARAASILAGLGFDEAAQARPCQSFSGGWRMRVALASALFNEPDLLLLDEPTNYLDLEGVIWLENFLKTYPRTVLLVSHDRDLLNGPIGGILHLSRGKLKFYTGGYDRFEERKRLEAEMHASQKSKQEAERRHIQSFVDRFRAKASKAKQAQSRIKMLERMKPIADIAAEHVQPFSFPQPEPLPPPLVQLEDVSTGYGDGKPVLSRLNLRLDMDDRIALLGANGNGKSTLAKLLSERLAPLSGRLRKAKKLKVGYFAQHQMDEFREGESPFDHMARLMPDAIPSKVRARLGRFGFGADKADNKIETLSGGEKARLLFALMSHAAPHLMILDEPTNHLDVESREILIHALNDYDGVIILISHDRHLLAACADRLWLVEDGTVLPYDEDLETYRRTLLAKRGGNKSKSKTIEGTGADRKAARREAAARRQKIAPLRKNIQEAESWIARLGKQLERIDSELADPVLYEKADPVKITALQKKKADTESELEAAEETWLAATEAFENAKVSA